MVLGSTYGFRQRVVNSLNKVVNTVANTRLLSSQLRKTGDLYYIFYRWHNPEAHVVNYSSYPSCMHWVKSRPPKCYLCSKSIKTNDHKLIHCDHCSNWIHRNCCNIDDSEYRQIVHSSCSWACPECNHFNFSNSLFDDTHVLHQINLIPLIMSTKSKLRVPVIKDWKKQQRTYNN